MHNVFNFRFIFWGSSQANQYASMAYWLFELKLLKKWSVREGHNFLSVSLKTGNKPLMWKVHPLHKEVSLFLEIRNVRRETYINNNHFFIFLPQSQTLFRFFTKWAPTAWISLSCKFLTHVLFLYLKSIKAAGLATS